MTNVKMKATPEAGTEYRERLYRNYLINCRGTDLADVRRSLEAYAPYLKRVIRSHVPADRGIKILDLGCGYGNLLYFLKQAGYTSLEGIDRSAAQVESARQLGLDFVVQGDVSEHLSVRPPASADVIFAFDVLEHFTKDEAIHFLDGVFRVLRPRGRLILHTPNGEGIFAGSVISGDYTHELTVNRASLAQLLRCVGFTNITSFEDIPVMHGLISTARWIVWKGFRTVMSVGYAAETGQLGKGLILSQNMLTVADK